MDLASSENRKDAIDMGKPENGLTSFLEPEMTTQEAQWLQNCLAMGRHEMFSQTVEITPSIACAIMRRNTHNRPFSAARSAKYAKIILDGRWRVTTEGIALDKNGVLQDGQHRLEAIKSTGVPTKLLIWFGSDPENFEVIGTGAPRTTGETAAIAKYSYYNLRASVAGHITRMNETKPDNNQIYQTLKRLADEDMDDALKFGSSCKDSKTCNPSAAALAYWHIKKNTKNPEKLPEFAKGFLTGANLSERNAILRIRNIINSAVIEKNSQQRLFKQAAALVMAWNAWINGRYLNSVAWPSVTKLPEVK